MDVVELLSVTEEQVEEFGELFAELNPSIIVSKEKIVKAIESPGTYVFVVLDDNEHIIGSATLCISKETEGQMPGGQVSGIRNQ